MKDQATNQRLQLLSGNHAVAMGVMLARPDVTPVYPITPQTPILEKLTELHGQGRLGARMLTPESEHSVMATCISASLTGARVFTATSSQGLMLMHELLHYASGARAPIVMFNVNRTPASPWGFWPDQLDSLSQRDTGWIQLYSESPQESLDLVIQAFRIAEQVELPVMVNHDAFYVSHAMEPVDVPEQTDIDSFLPPFHKDLRLDVTTGRAFGAPADQATWNRTRRDMARAMDRVPNLFSEVGNAWQSLTGRASGPLETYRMDDADRVFVVLGSLAGTVRDAVDALREKGVRAGLAKLRLLRPLPVALLRDLLCGRDDVLVLDRDYSPGMGGILHQEVAAALHGAPRSPRLHGFLTGVGGVNVPIQRLVDLAEGIGTGETSFESVWVD